MAELMLPSGEKIKLQQWLTKIVVTKAPGTIKLDATLTQVPHRACPSTKHFRSTL